MQTFDNAAPPKQQAAPAKALRFVTNYGAPHPKRRRIGAACLTCRKRKTACSGERPFCETCKQNKLECAGYSSESATPTNKRSASDAGLRRPSEHESNIKRSQSVKKTESSYRNNAGPEELRRTVSGEQSPRQTTEGMNQATNIPKDGELGQDSLFSGPRNRMPYFRWLGPTAIMPGFKQMVVKVKRQDTDTGRSSTDGLRSPSLTNQQSTDQKLSSSFSATPQTGELDTRTQLNLPFYDTSSVPPSELITHLANTFFTHLGCNYPFLQRDRFLRDLEEKQVDAILVDAVCALAARFSTHQLLTQAAGEGGAKATPAEYGHAFAQRAKTALVDTFACPSVAAAQAALLLAYNEFGEQRDSGLWMYLGISIRLAEDLGLHKLEGLRYVGKDGPTPRAVKRQSRSGASSDAAPISRPANSRPPSKEGSRPDEEPRSELQRQLEEAIAVEQERVDTLWAIFLLDRYVSSGTGRRSTLRDKDIELSFPALSQTGDDAEWPAPFPALIRIVHLYGRVADLLNSIKEPSDITTETPKRLAMMEIQVTTFYQNLSPRLHFDAMNFQHYMKAGEGTNFVLLHFWFHTLIILLHQPTLLKTFEGRMLQLFPNSQQLSMSSAKTIADILSYSQLIDAKASLGNPFTTQPIYIAACAFLKETAEQTATSNAQSRAASPSRKIDNASDGPATTNGVPGQSFRKASISQITGDSSTTDKPTTGSTVEQKSKMAKHTLLATAASQHYQLCHKALQSLERYWAGTKYILTILDQKHEGVLDPLLYTTEEAESSMEQPKPEPAFTSPGWRRKLSWSMYNAQPNIDTMQSPFWPPKGLVTVPGSPRGVDAGKAIGWTLTGTMNSPSTNLAWHFASGNNNNSNNNQNPNLDPRLSAPDSSDYEGTAERTQPTPYTSHLRTGSSNSQRLGAQEKLGRQAMQNYTSASSHAPGHDANVLARGSPYGQPGHAPVTAANTPYTASMTGHLPANGGMNGNMGPPYPAMGAFASGHAGGLPMNFMPGDMMIEQQDVDMSMLGLDMMPWFDSYPTHDMMGFDPNGNTAAGAQQFDNRHT